VIRIRSASLLAATEFLAAYGTNNAVDNVPLLTSTDLVHWTEHGDVLPTGGSWATPGDTWAPEMVRTDAGKYVIYYTARSKSADRQFIGAAVADDPRGPSRRAGSCGSTASTG
jgi:beta-xylosidase